MDSGSRAGTTVHVVGSASIWVLGLAAGPRRTATVIESGRNAVYLDLEGTAVGVLGTRAVQVPCGVRTDLPELPDLPVGTEGVVHDGAIELPGVEVLVTNIVDTTVPVLSGDAITWGAERLQSLVGDRLKPALSELPDDALDRLRAADPAAVPALLGVGEGTTPTGDDVLGGWLATAVAARHPGLPEIRSAVALAAFERTSLLATTLLACAARGEGIPELRILLSGVATGNDHVVEQSLDLLLGLKRSGAGLVLGCLLALQS